MRNRRRPIQLHFPWIPEGWCSICLRQRLESTSRRARIRRQEPLIFTKERAEAAMQRLIERFLRRTPGPPDPLEQDLIIEDLSVCMGHLFELGYRDFDSNNRKLMEQLSAAVALRADRVRLERDERWERKMADMMRTVSPRPERLN